MLGHCIHSISHRDLFNPHTAFWEKERMKEKTERKKPFIDICSFKIFIEWLRVSVNRKTVSRIDKNRVATCSYLLYFMYIFSKRQHQFFTPTNCVEWMNNRFVFRFLVECLIWITQLEPTWILFHLIDFIEAHSIISLQYFTTDSISPRKNIRSTTES